MAGRIKRAIVRCLAIAVLALGIAMIGFWVWILAWGAITAVRALF